MANVVGQPACNANLQLDELGDYDAGRTAVTPGIALGVSKRKGAQQLSSDIHAERNHQNDNWQL